MTGTHLTWQKRIDVRQDRQCTYNVILRRVHETIVTVEKQLVLHVCVWCVVGWVSVGARGWACAY